MAKKQAKDRSTQEKSLSGDSLIGRESELERIRACIQARRNILLEGPVGVGKTHLALAATGSLRAQVFRIDGDSRYSEQKLSGWFDPPAVLKKGFTKEAFIPGPLIEAMQSGGVLFINELNRLPEGVQNVLLPAIDERKVVVPRLGEVIAREGFVVIATQNPKEFVATSHLSEAILDRFELVVMEYQSAEEEERIVGARLGLDLDEVSSENFTLASLVKASVHVVRSTREHPKIRRGASIRAALSTAEIARILIEENRRDPQEAFRMAVLLALPTRIEMERDIDIEKSPHGEIRKLLEELSENSMKAAQSPDQSDSLKKKS